jgi:peptide/nickel transport system ATP-binding protein
MTVLLEARRVTKVFRSGLIRKHEVVALEDFSLAIASSPPSITAIVGESGSGKTTFARLLLGVIAPSEGEVLYEGRNLQALSRAERRAFRRDVQVIFQDPYESYNPFYRVDHVLTTPIEKFRLASSRQAARALIEETLRAVGLRPEETLGRYPHQLSGGQRQRVMMARALLIRPRLIIADEPVSMVDASMRATILASLQKLNQEFGISLIYITHDLTTAYHISENIIVLYRGAVAEAGDVGQVVGSPRHPYTRLLIGSIPLPDPDHPWLQERLPVDVPPAALDPRKRCAFADRCPEVMPMCWEGPPPLYQTDAHRVAACFLYRDAPALPTDQMGSVFIGVPAKPVAAAPRTPAS